MFRDLVPLIVAGLVPIALLILIVTAAAFSLVAWQPPILNSIMFGTSNSDNGITAITSDSSGVYAAGFIGQSLYGFYNVTPSFLFVNKYTLDGGALWTSHFDSPSLSRIYGVVAGVNGIFVAGIGNVSAFVRGFDSSGNKLWISLFGSVGTVVSSIQDGSSGIYLGGYNQTNNFLREYRYNGTLAWSRTVGTGSMEMNIVTVSNYVYAFASGVFQKYDSSGNLLLNRTCLCSGTGIVADSSGIYFAGPMTVNGVPVGFLAKYDFNGNQLWNSSFNAPGYNGIGSVSIASDSSGVYLSAITSAEAALVMKYGTGGTKVWSFQLPLSLRILYTGAPITVQSSMVFVGGESKANFNAFLSELSASSSLVFLGVNPPFSFIILALIITIIGVGIFGMRRQLMKLRRTRRPAPNKIHMIQRWVPRIGYCR